MTLALDAYFCKYTGGPEYRPILLVKLAGCHNLLTKQWLTWHHRNLIYIECSLELVHFWLLKQWHYYQVQKLVLDRYLRHFSLELCGLILFSDF